MVPSFFSDFADFYRFLSIFDRFSPIFGDFHRCSPIFAGFSPICGVAAAAARAEHEEAGAVRAREYDWNSAPFGGVSEAEPRFLFQK